MAFRLRLSRFVAMPADIKAWRYQAIVEQPPIQPGYGNAVHVPAMPISASMPRKDRTG